MTIKENTKQPIRLRAKMALGLAALTTAAATAFSFAGLPALAPATAMQEPDEAAINSEAAASLYKHLKELQFGGGDEAEIDEAAYKAFIPAFAILSSDTVSDHVADQCRGILQDLNPALARAAVHASMKGDSEKMGILARAYVDTRLLPQMSSAEFQPDKELYPSLVYTAASSSYNAGKINDAIKYFEEYLRTGETKNREQVALFYGQSLMKTSQQARGLDAIVNAANEFPTNNNLLTMAMQFCLDTSRRDLLPPLLERALTFNPDDEKLLNLQAQVNESRGEFRPALDIYTRLAELHPNSLNISECVARCYFNLATSYYNQSITAVDDKEVAKARRQSNAYFSNATEKFEELVENEPNNIKFLRALTMAYACLGNKSKVDALNVRLQALGDAPMAMNTMPVTIGDHKAEAAGPRNIPSYQEYAQGFVTTEMTKWAKRGEFEKVDDYTKRMSAESILAEQKRLSAITAENYLKEYANHIVPSEFKLQPYDVENETYAIESDFGPVYVKVPLKNKEAELFKSNWEKMQIRNTKFFIKDDRIAISTITFQAPNGKDYTYNSSAALAYEPPVVYVDPSKFSTPAASSAAAPKNDKTGGKKIVLTAESDVDKNIPVNKNVNSNTIALVMANENYNKVTQVASAQHDGDVFARYCRETLGIPENQVLEFTDLTYGNTLSAINRLKNTVKAMGPDTEVIVYYAGHGVPDENTSDAYLLPVDADPMVMATAYPLSKFYEELSSMDAANVVVFMDACFSGANRGEGMLAEARGVVLKAKPAAPKGNMFVLSAADGNETALPWKEKNHGLFTYFLLKKLQESKGNATLAEIADYVKAEVSKTASLQLNKPQNPKMTVSGSLASELGKKKLRK